MSTGRQRRKVGGRTRRSRSAAQESVVALLRAADDVRHHLESVVASAGVTLPQYNVLRILRGADPEGLPTLDVAERLMQRTPGISRMMDRLERRGWVERHRHADDRRQVLCGLTAAGRSLLASLDDAVDDADEEATGALDAAERRQLVRLLEKVRESLG